MTARRSTPLLAFVSTILFATAERSAADEQTMADILPTTACQPCHQTVPKLKLLPRDVLTLFREHPDEVHTSPFPPDLSKLFPPTPKQ